MLLINQLKIKTMENQIEVFDFAFTGKTKASKGSRYFTAAQQTALESLAVGKYVYQSLARNSVSPGCHVARERSEFCPFQ